MELNQRLLVEIADIFKKVQYGRITFFLSPEKKNLDYTVKTNGKILIAATDSSVRDKKHLLQKNTAEYLE